MRKNVLWHTFYSLISWTSVVWRLWGIQQCILFWIKENSHLPLSLAQSFKTSPPSPSSRKELWDKTHTQKPLEFVQIIFCWHLKQIPWNWPQIFKMSLLGNGSTMGVEREWCTPGYTNFPNQRVKNKGSFILNGYKTHIHQTAVVRLETKACKWQLLT